jgi:hypothetical protein
MVSSAYSSRCRLVLTLFAAVACGPGCAILTPGSTDVAQLPDLGADAAGQMAQQPEGMITLEIRPAAGQPEAHQLPLTESMRIQTALEQAELPKRFKRMELYVMRPAGQQRHKLESKYMHKKGGVNPLYDYSLRPGDHLVVVEDTRNMFDDILESIGGPLFRTLGG